MDSLLASYGSDEEESDSPPGSPIPATLIPSAPLNFSIPAGSSSRPTIFGSLPAPRNSVAGNGSSRPGIFGPLPPPRNSVTGNGSEDELPKSLKRKAVDDSPETVKPGSLFASLPPPRTSATESIDFGESIVRGVSSSRAGNLQATNCDIGEKKHGSSLFASLPPPRRHPTPMHSDVQQNSTSSSRSQIHSADNESPTRRPEKSSFFARLPSPVKSNRLFEKLPTPFDSKLAAEKIQKKKVVEFKPPIDFSLLDETEEDEAELKKPREVLTESLMSTGSKAASLTALLPAPKNSFGMGAALGGGTSGGRRPAMETHSDSIINVVQVNVCQETTPSLGDNPRMPEPRNLENAELNAAEPLSSSIEGSYGQYDSNSNLTPHSGFLDVNDQDVRSLPYIGTTGIGTRSQTVPLDDAFTEVMKKERRKGRDEFPLEMIEVKQADLTGGSRLRQDQLHSTGIAFGPSYQPVKSANKDKPSKLHRRKHQIGALFFDMKQNEMNLMDRRSKGSLTKAETQAKYGW